MVQLNKLTNRVVDHSYNACFFEKIAPQIAGNHALEWSVCSSLTVHDKGAVSSASLDDRHSHTYEISREQIYLKMLAHETHCYIW